MKRVVASLLGGLAFAGVAAALELEMEVDGVERVSRVYLPDTVEAEGSPVLLAFHGYDDDRHNFSRFVDLHKEWPEAIVVYPQGLRLPDNEGRLQAKGWQFRVGQHGDRDLRFVDALLARLSRNYPVDPGRIHAAGMSNGGRFAFLLWAERPERFAGFAPVAISATAPGLSGIDEPRPVIYMIGRGEPEARLRNATPTVETIARVNRSSRQPEPWGDYVYFPPRDGGAAFVFNLHRAGHVWPHDASAAIVRFLRPVRLPDEAGRISVREIPERDGTRP